MLSKSKRLQKFIQRLQDAPAASSADEAFDLLAKILNAVEDEFSEVPNRPELWETDSRMYPPQEDSRVKCPERPNDLHCESIATRGTTTSSDLTVQFASKRWTLKSSSISPATTNEKRTNWGSERAFRLM